MVEGLSTAFKAAFACNILGTVMLGSSMYCNHPLVFLAIVSLGVLLLGVGFAIWLKMVIGEALGSGLFR